MEPVTKPQRDGGKPMIKCIILIALTLFGATALAQATTAPYHFNYKVLEASGDLNKDNLPDKVIVTQDTLHENAPYRLQVFFKQPNGKSRLIVTSYKIIAPQYPDGRDGYDTGNRFSDVTIIKGVLSVNYELLRGHFEHKFRYRNGNFELIGYTEGQSNGRGEMYYIDFNLSTGVKHVEVANYETDSTISNKKTKRIIRPLPKLQDIEPFINDHYLR